MKCFFEKALLSGHFHECAPLPSDEDLFNGKIQPEFLSAPYSPQEFAEHTKNIIKLLDHTKYRFYPLPEPSFLDVQLIISEKRFSGIENTVGQLLKTVISDESFSNR